MAQTVKLKRSNTAGTIPTTSNLALGEVAINTKDGKFFLRKHVDGSTGDAIHAYAPQGLNAFGTQELVVKVVTKTTAHPNHGNGSSNGYTVQGLEGPFLALIPGNTYKFDVSDSTNSGHPFRFYLDAAKATAYTTGVTTSGSAGNSGAYVQIAVTTSTPQVLYYQCSNHGLMGSAAYVASDAIAANAVGTSQIAQNSITSSEIPNNSIGATQISAAVLAAKQDNLGNNSITAAMISQNTVGISELNVSDGSANQVLTTDGSGTLSFANPSSGTVTETFKTISVSGQDDVVADGATDTLTLAAGSGMTITTNASNDTVTFVSSAAGIADDAVTTSKIADLNVTSAKLANNSVTAAKIATDAVGASEIAANSVGISELNVSDGSNGQVLTTNGSGTLSFTTAGGGSVSEAFKTLSVSGQDDVVADSATDTLTFAAGSNMTITTNASNDTVTFASSGSGGSSSSFAKNTFSGDGSTTAFTLTTSMSNENGLIVFIDGVYQADNVYSVSGTTLTFATAPVNGRVIEVFQLEGGIVGTAPVLATMTGDGSDTTLALGTTPSSENQCFVTIDGVMQHKSTYSVSGSTLTFSTAPPNGTAVEAITLTNTSVATFEDSDGDTKIQMEESNDEDKIRFDTGGTERMIIDDAGKVGIGTTSPSQILNVEATSTPVIEVSTLDDNNPASASALDLVEKQPTHASSTATFGQAGVYGYRVQLNGSDNTLRIKSGSQTTVTDRITLDRDTGNVGIGTTSPAKTLHITSADAQVLRVESSHSYSGIEIKGSGSSTLPPLISALGDDLLIYGGHSGLRVNVAKFASDGKVGIGTTSPSTSLEVIGDIKIKEGSAFSNYGLIDVSEAVLTLETYSVNTSTHPADIVFKTAGTEAVRLTTGGALSKTRTSVGTILGHNVYWNGSNYSNINTSYGSKFIQIASDAFYFRRTASGSGNQSASYDMTIDSSGNVGIGTTTINTGTLGTSNTFLEVAAGTKSGSGTIILSRTTSGNNNEVGGLRFVNSDNADDDGLDYDGKLVAAISARSVTSNSNAYDNSGGNLIFYTKPEGGNYSERIRIGASGNVGIGTATATHRLEVLSTLANYASGRIINNTGSGSTEYGFISQLANDPNNTTNYFYLGQSPSTTRFVVYSNGNVANTNNSYGAYSDVKLKENIVDANPQLEKIKQLQVRNFNLKAEPDKKLIGLVAQEAETIFPKLIDETEDTENDENGAIVKTGETTKAIKYSVFVPVLIKAIQEQQTIIEDLKSRIETLEG